MAGKDFSLLNNLVNSPAVFPTESEVWTSWLQEPTGAEAPPEPPSAKRRIVTPAIARKSARQPRPSRQHTITGVILITYLIRWKYSSRAYAHLVLSRRFAATT